jgi:polyisoprenoid-binding protein YceI
MALEQWEFDLVHSSIGFWVRHMMVTKVHGRFAKWNGKLEFDEQAPAASRVELQIEAASIDTQEPQRDGHLRSADFLDAEKFPSLTFKSTSVEPAGEGNFRVKGDLTIRGTRRPVVLEVEYGGRVQDPAGGQRVGFSARTSLSRKDFGLNWNQALEAGGVLVGDKVEVLLEVEAVRKAAQGPVAATRQSA